MTRRGLIHRLLLIFTVQSIVPWRRAGRQGLEAAQLTPRPAEPPTESLSELELDDLVAFGEVVVGPGSLSPLERGYLVDHIGYQARRASGYYLSAYRTTVSLLAREELKEVWKALDAVSAQQRTIFLLRYAEEMSLAEIAGVLGLAIGSVKAQLFRATSRVREVLRKKQWR